MAIILKFRNKFIYLDNFQLGFAAYIATLGVMWFIEWRKKRGSISTFLNNALTVRGGDFYLQKFLNRRLKAGTLYEVVNPRLIRYILQLTNSLDSKQILYIDLETLVYAIRTFKKPRLSELLINKTDTIFGLLNPVKSLGSLAIGTST